ncbi:hypothetical protein HanPSC8_Chr03g0085891 [Helianthus annuus]|nr:hypothetical protein HanPSC8_Chr03g0085891 [Helianthus annuus]
MYALDTQMGTNYKAELIPQRTRDTIHGWGKEARRMRKRLFNFGKGRVDTGRCQPNHH